MSKVTLTSWERCGVAVNPNLKRKPLLPYTIVLCMSFKTSVAVVVSILKHPYVTCHDCQGIGWHLPTLKYLDGYTAIRIMLAWDSLNE